MRPGGECALKQRMLTADMIEHAVEHDTQPAVMGRLDERIEIALVAEPPVDLEVIDRVVAMHGRGEDRPEQKPRGSEIHGVIQPRNEMTKAMRNTGAGTGLELGPDETERIDVPPDRPLDPVS